MKDVDGVLWCANLTQCEESLRISADKPAGAAKVIARDGNSLFFKNASKMILIRDKLLGQREYVGLWIKLAGVTNWKIIILAFQ